jgi:glycosyltransferase involved in cell wall biosynthesis
LKFIFLTQYYPPETGAPQNRLSSLAINLAKLGQKVTVLTAMPNYPKMVIADGYKGKLYVKETDGEVEIKRVWLYTKPSTSKYVRLLNYLSFCFTSFFAGLFTCKKGDVMICESPPLFLGITAVLLCKIKGTKLVFNVSDLWPESVEKVGLLTNPSALKVLYKLEKWIYKNAHLLSGQTQGIVAELRKYKPAEKVFWLKNGIDYSFLEQTVIDTEWRAKNNFKQSDFILMYGGIIGFAQALHVIIEAADKLKHIPEIRFILVGDGPEKQRLLDLVESYKLTNVTFVPNTPRDQMLSIVSACDVSLVPLKKIEHFLGAIPSKIFEALAFKKPILLGVDGEARDLFITEGKTGLFVEPEDIDDLAANINVLYQDRNLMRSLGENGYTYARQNFDRKIISAQFLSFTDQLK